MKRTHILTLLLLTGSTFFGSTTFAQVGIQAGVIGVLGESFSTHDLNDKLGGTYGFTAGVLYELPLTSILTLQPSLNWLNKSWSDELDDGVEITKTKMIVNYLELPIQLVLRQPRVSGFFIGIGPSILYGLSGKRTVTVDGSQIISDDYVFGSEEGSEQKITLALNAMAGYSFGKIKLHLNYSKGITNQPGEGSDFGNDGHLALRFGYVFSTK